LQLPHIAWPLEVVNRHLCQDPLTNVQILLALVVLSKEIRSLGTTPPPSSLDQLNYNVVRVETCNLDSTLTNKDRSAFQSVFTLNTEKSSY